MNAKKERIRKLSQVYTYATIRTHEAIARKAGLSGTDISIWDYNREGVK